MPEFTIRPSPKEGEALQGYLLRVAKENGRQSINDLLTASGYKKKDLQYFGSDNQKLMDQLSPWVCRWPLERFKKHFNGYLDLPWLYKEHRRIENALIVQPRLCTECFKEDSSRFFRFEWALLHHSYCEQHRIELIDSCPVCNHQLKWKYKIFTQCTNCESHWDDVESTVVDSNNYYQDEFVSVVKSEGSINDWYQNFTQRLVFAARPYDLLHTNAYRLPNDLVGINQLIKQAKLMQNDLALDKDLIEWNPKGWVQPKRMQYISTMQHHIEYIGVSKSLGIPADQVSYLVSNSIIEPINSSKALHAMFFDNRQIQKLLDSCEVTKEEAIDEIQLYESHKLFRCYFVSYGDVLVESLKYKQTKRFADGFAQIVLPKTLAKKVLNQCMRHKLANNSLGKYKVEFILGIAAQKAGILDLFDMSLSSESSDSRVVDGNTMLSYMEKNQSKLKNREKIIQAYL